MATAFPLPVTAAQVGTHFVRQYYQVLQLQPDFVHQFYSDASTMIRTDGNTSETAMAMQQIHTLVMSLNYTRIEIKTAHSLESWSGVLVTVSGTVYAKNFSGRRKFVQTFFLAPQENGYFVLNDIFHFLDEEPIHHHSVAYFPQNSLDPKVNVSATIQEPVSNYMLNGDDHSGEFISPAEPKENGHLDNYSFAEHRHQHILKDENVIEDNFMQSNAPVQNVSEPVLDHLSAPIEEATGEPQKHTYASIWWTSGLGKYVLKASRGHAIPFLLLLQRVAKGQPIPSVPCQPSINRSTPSPEWNHVPEPPQQSLASAVAVESSGANGAEDVSAVEEGEIKSVYVRNLPPTVSASEIEEEFKKFGKLGFDAVAIRNRKDIGVYYAFVEFEDYSGVQNAIEAATVQIAGHQVFIEGRRVNRLNVSRGGRRGRGRDGYQSEAPRGRFVARSLGRGSGQDGVDRDYNRPRGNGYYRSASRQ